MPIYEYRCTQCEHKLETLQRLSEAPLVTCPACGKDALQKLVSAAGFQLKGSGWYATDFRGGSKSSEKPSADKPAESKPETTKSDATAGKSDSTTTSTPAASGSTTKAA